MKTPGPRHNPGEHGTWCALANRPPTSPKGPAAFAKSLGGWSKAASKVAGSYKDKLMQANPNEAAQVSKLLALVAERTERLKK